MRRSCTLLVQVAVGCYPGYPATIVASVPVAGNPGTVPGYPGMVPRYLPGKLARNQFLYIEGNACDAYAKDYA